MSTTSTFGQWLKERRRELDLTQEAIAEAASCSTETIRKIEAGRRRPSRQMAQHLAEQLDIDPRLRPAFVQWARGASYVSPFDPLSTEETEGQPQAAAPATSAGTGIETLTFALRPSSSLPALLTPLIGRDRELAHVRAMLWHSTTRLLILLGPPGIGKTSLSIAVASTLQADFKDGLLYVPLGPVHDATLVAAVIGEGLRVRQTSTRSLLDSLQDALCDKQMLLILDNFEHVGPAAPLLTQLLIAAPQLKILVTSRSVLHLRGEKLVEVPPLEVPDRDHLPPIEELARLGSVALFVERVRDARGDFELTTENAFLVAAICARLDGLPLAIELAAARTRILSLSNLYSRMERQLALLTGGPCDAPLHQQTLRSSLESSYTSLDSDEQQLFRRLGIFAGAFTLEAAEVVASANLDSLESILDQSLLHLHRPLSGEGKDRVFESGEADMRFAMLTPIREYALEQLDLKGERHDVALAHARYFRDLALAVHNGSVGPDQKAELELATASHDDIRVALAWSLKNGESEIALSMATDLAPFWLYGYRVEGLRWLEEALAMSSTLPAELRAKGWQVASHVAQAQSDYAKSRQYAEESLSLYQGLGETHGIALAFNALGVAAAEEGDYKQALTLFGHSLAAWRESGNIQNVGVMLFNLSFLAVRSGDYNRAIQLSQESIDTYRSSVDAIGIAAATINLGLAFLHKEEYEVAIELEREGMALAKEIGSKRHIARALIYLGLARLSQGDYRQAEAHYRESLAISQELSDAFGVVRVLVGLAGVAVGEDRARLAVRLTGAADASGHGGVKNLTPVEIALQERTLERARQTLDETEFAAVWIVGRSLSIEAAAASAIAWD